MSKSGLRWTEEQYQAYIKGQGKYMLSPPPGGESGPAKIKNISEKPELKMNKTEARYADQLEIMKRSGEIIDYVFEPFKLKLARKTYYTPDFLVVRRTGRISEKEGIEFFFHFEIHEVKGFWRDDARVKIKVAARLFPWFSFRAVQYVKGEWKEERISA